MATHLLDDNKQSNPAQINSYCSKDQHLLGRGSKSDAMNDSYSINRHGNTGKNRALQYKKHSNFAICGITNHSHHSCPKFLTRSSSVQETDFSIFSQTQFLKNINIFDTASKQKQPRAPEISRESIP